jgi:hypothetical protein
MNCEYVFARRKVTKTKPFNRFPLLRYWLYRIIGIKKFILHIAKSTVTVENGLFEEGMVHITEINLY